MRQDPSGSYSVTDKPRELMVTKLSAERIGHHVRNIEHLSSNTDHRGLVRFEHSLDGRYVSVIEKLKGMAAEAHRAFLQPRSRSGYFLGKGSPHSAGAIHSSRCVSVPFATAPTFTERPQLSQELLERLGKAHGTGLAHATAVIGLGGTGKTQLVLRYIEERQENYDTIFWIDVQSEETARSSYERCCRMAGLPIEAATDDVPLHYTPAVQAVLSWLDSKGEDKRWLVVLDHADDLSWDVGGIVPKGKAGTVIVTSQDSQAARLLGGRTPAVRVDAMEPEEAVRLVANYFDKSLCYGDSCRILIEEITECLDRLAFAMDLAGTRVQVDVENGGNLATALHHYLADYRRSKDELLRDEEFASISTYKKTVWTAWETSLASLRRAEDRQSNIYPIQLLRFATMLDRANVQDELFRLASVGLQEACRRLDIKTPAWMQGLLDRGDDDRWDDFSYRATVKLLLRYGLVRPIAEPWNGITMHGLVGWRASVGMDREQYWRLYLAFISAICARLSLKTYNGHFRRHVLVHFPANMELLKNEVGLKAEGLWCLWTNLGSVLYEEGKWNEAEELQVKVMEARSRVLGEEHPDTLTAMANLASTYRNQGRWKEAEELEVKVMEASSRVLGEEHPDSLTAMANLAYKKRDLGQNDLAIDLMTRSATVSSRVLGHDHSDSEIRNEQAALWSSVNSTMESPSLPHFLRQSKAGEYIKRGQRRWSLC